jgi:hydroxymethylglutaryl-CoA lyase
MMASVLPARVSLFEVAPRDGFQNESTILPTEKKIAFIDCLSAAGFTDIEAGSFVSPKWIPQLADTRAVLKGIARRPGTRYWVLVPNLKGFQEARDEGVDCVAVFMSSSETHNRKNVNRTIDQSLTELREVIGHARDAGMRVRAYLSTVFGCPYEGPVAVEQVERLSRELIEAGAHQLSLGDTIGVANPVQVGQVIERLSRTLPLDRLALHFHDTRGTAVANVMAGLQAGITVYDGSMSGIGGCPYAPGASGNVATEDLLYLLTAIGIETGIDLQAAAGCGVFLRELLGRELPGRYHNYYVGSTRRAAEKARRAGESDLGG